MATMPQAMHGSAEKGGAKVLSDAEVEELEAEAETQRENERAAQAKIDAALRAAAAKETPG